MIKRIASLLATLAHTWNRSIRRQLAWSFSLITLLLMIVTGCGLFLFQKNFLYTQANQKAFSIANALSFSCRHPILENDIVGLQEVLQNFSKIMDFEFAVILSPQGEVLAFTHPVYFNQANDAISKKLLTLPAYPQILLDTNLLIDVAVPIKVEERLIAWVRVELNRQSANAHLQQLIIFGIAVGSLLLAMITLISTRLAHYLTDGLNRLSVIASNAERGLPFQYKELDRDDEIGVLARHLYQAIETIEAGKKARFDSELRLRTIFNTLHDLIWLKDTDGFYLACNPMFERFLGATEAEIIGKTDYDFFDIALADFFRNHDKIAMASHLPTVNEEWLTFADNGYHGLFETVKTPMYHESGKLIGVLGIARDVTRRKQTEAELKRHRDQLEQLVEKRTAALVIAKEAAEAANIAKSTFIATMSHELRTPLNAILGFSELLSQDGTLNDSQKETLAIINRSGAHLLSMINAVLDISKIEAGRAELLVEACDFPQLLQDIGDMIKVRANNKQLNFELDIAEDIARYIKIDTNKLRQVLINLLANAIKFTQQGSVKLHAHSTPLANSDKVKLHIEVIDTGIGIPENLQAELFKPFVQLMQKNTDSQGTGLGLTISKSLIELMGGTIKVRSRVGVGSAFSIDLPVSMTSADHIVFEEPSPLVDKLAPDQPPCRLLVVDDNADNRLLLSTLLTNAGFQVHEASNGQEAIELFLEWQPALCWMDMRMPVMDGYQATEKIRQLPNGHQVKIIAITASAFKEQHEQIIKAGCDDVLHKPFHAQEVFTILSKQLGVKFIYQHTQNASTTPLQELTPAAFATLPTLLQQQLHEAALQLDTDQLENIINEIAVISPDIASSLQVLAKRYQFEHIIRLSTPTTDSL